MKRMAGGRRDNDQFNAIAAVRLAQFEEQHDAVIIVQALEGKAVDVGQDVVYNLPGRQGTLLAYQCDQAVEPIHFTFGVHRLGYPIRIGYKNIAGTQLHAAAAI
jgi:hypothetical protein